jgi:hypothetical protein
MQIKHIDKPSFVLSKNTLKWFQRMTNSHKRIYNDEEFRRQLTARMISFPMRRLIVDFDIEN